MRYARIIIQNAASPTVGTCPMIVACEIYTLRKAVQSTEIELK
jgi:hypothetical protein